MNVPSQRQQGVGGQAAPGLRVVLTVEEAAESLAIGRTLMYELISTGAVESVLIGRLRRVRAEALSDFVARLRAGGLEPENAA